MLRRARSLQMMSAPAGVAPRRRDGAMDERLWSCARVRLPLRSESYVRVGRIGGFDATKSRASNSG
jgi:hypothetical protein